VGTIIASAGLIMFFEHKIFRTNPIAKTQHAEKNRKLSREVLHRNKKNVKKNWRKI
jgi:hypothetical protein